MDNISKGHRVWLTTILFFSSFAYGLTSYILGLSEYLFNVQIVKLILLGPALNEFCYRVNTDLNHMSIVLAIVGVFYAIGALGNGFLYTIVNRQILFSLLLLIGASVITFAPYSTAIWQLYIVGVLAGFICGGFDTANLVWLVELWMDNPFLCLLGTQFFFSVGTFVSPLISRPFLSKNETVICDRNTSSSNLVSSDSSSPCDNITILSYTRRTESRIEIPFAIVGSVLFISFLTLFITHFVRRYHPPSIVVRQTSVGWTRHKILSLLVGIFQISPYVGMEISNFQLLSTYSIHSYLQMDDQNSASTQSIFAGTFALSRGLSIFVARKMRPKKLLPIHFVIILVANTLVVMGDKLQWPKEAFWASEALLGIGFSVVLPTTYTFIEQSIEITDLVGGIFVCSGGTMIAFFCLICGTFIEDTPLILYYFNYGAVLCILTAFIASCYLQRNPPNNSFQNQ